MRLMVLAGYENILDKADIKSLADCYVKIFNVSWQEDWTLETATEILKKDLYLPSTRMPLLSILKDQNNVIGFAWMVVCQASEFSIDDMPYDLPSDEKERGVKAVAYWARMAGHSLIGVFKELGAYPDFQYIKKRHTASLLSLPIFNIARRMGCKTFFYWTSAGNPTYKHGLGFEWHPIHFFPDWERVILKGSIENSIYYLNGILKRNVAILKKIKRNRHNYFCN
jgi:hypothetical protein